jgi:hypothetical protein
MAERIASKRVAPSAYAASRWTTGTVFSTLGRPQK